MAPVTQSIFTAFAREERGSVAVIFGVTAMMLLLVIGVAIDYARHTHSQSKIAAAADAAALAAGRALMEGAMSDAEIEALGVRFFNENMARGGTFVKVRNVQIVPDRIGNSVEVVVDADTPVTVMRVAGHKTMDASVDSVTTFASSDLELGLALDITGSMCDIGRSAPCDSARKLDALKSAANDLIDTLITDKGGPNKVRIGLAPYAASVQLGAYANAASGGTSGDGCVRERAGAGAYEDLSIEDGGAYRGRGRWTDIDPTQFRQSYSCPDAAVVPLTESKDVLKASIAGYSAQGSTAGHIGAQWAWNLISPNFASLWPSASEPAAYNDDKTTKAIVLMTDGLFNMAYDNGTSSAQALSICRGAGGKGVNVYAVAFEAEESAKALLKSCAEEAGGTFHEAENAEDLREVFVAIAKSLSDLRLTQ